MWMWAQSPAGPRIHSTRAEQPKPRIVTNSICDLKSLQILENYKCSLVTRELTIVGFNKSNLSHVIVSLFSQRYNIMYSNI